MHPSGVLPFYNLYLAKPDDPIEPPYLIYDLSLTNVTYLIVDERMANELPELGVYFTSADPASVGPQNGISAFRGKLDKFNTMKWMVKIYQSDNYSIYRLNLPVTPNSYQRQPPKLQGKKLLRGKLSVAS